VYAGTILYVLIHCPPGAIVIAIAIPQILGIVLGRVLVGQIEGQWDRYKRDRQHSAYRKARNGGGGGDRGSHVRARYWMCKAETLIWAPTVCHIVTRMAVWGAPMVAVAMIAMSQSLSSDTFGLFPDGTFHKPPWWRYINIFIYFNVFTIVFKKIMACIGFKIFMVELYVCKCLLFLPLPSNDIMWAIWCYCLLNNDTKW